LSEAALAELVVCYWAGASLRELARRYGVHRGSVQRALRKHGKRRLGQLDVEDALGKAPLCHGISIPEGV
jgi:transposase